MCDVGIRWFRWMYDVIMSEVVDRIGYATGCIYRLRRIALRGIAATW
jgi:hypothetical protein